MSTLMIIVIVVGGCLAFGVGMTVLMVWWNRRYKNDEQAMLQRLHEQAAQRGWKYEARNDDYVWVYNAEKELTRSPLVKMPTRRDPLAPLRGFRRPPKALKARDIITGMHRGRAFIAAEFYVRSADGQADERVIWVRTPAQGPFLRVTRTSRVHQRISRGIGQGDFRVGNQEFDDLFDISHEDEQFTRAVLNPAVVEYLLNAPRKIRSMAFLNDRIALSYQFTASEVFDHRDPDQLITALDMRCDVLDRIPESAWAQGHGDGWAR